MPGVVRASTTDGRVRNGVGVTRAPACVQQCARSMEGRRGCCYGKRRRAAPSAATREEARPYPRCHPRNLSRVEDDVGVARTADAATRGLIRQLYRAETRASAVFNPGSVCPRRFALPIVFGVMEVDASGVKLRHVVARRGGRGRREARLVARRVKRNARGSGRRWASAECQGEKEFCVRGRVPVR